MVFSKQDIGNIHRSIYVEDFWEVKPNFYGQILINTYYASRNGYCCFKLPKGVVDNLFSDLEKNPLRKRISEILGKLEDLDVHGGITYYLQKEKDFLIIGFDTNHSFDIPDYESMEKYEFFKEHKEQIIERLSYKSDNCDIITFDFVKNEVNKLVNQVYDIFYEDEFLLQILNENKDY